MRLRSKWRQCHAHSAKSFAPRGKQLPTISAAAAPASEKEPSFFSLPLRSFPFPFSLNSPFLLRGSRGKFSFSLPFSLTLQTATRRLLTTHPYSSDFPFVFSVVCVSPAIRLSLRSACSLPHGSRTPSRGGYPRPREIQYLPSGQNQTKKTLRH